MEQTDYERLCAGLRASPVFGGLDTEHIQAICSRIADSVIIGSYHAGDRVSSECGINNENGALGVVLDGSLVISRARSDGQEAQMVLNVIGKGGCFGVCSLFSDGFRMPPTTITSSGESAAAFICERDLTELLLSDSEVCTAYLRFLTGRICFLNEKLYAFSGSTVNERVAQALLSAAGFDGDGRLCCRSSMTGLARRLNISRASLYRALGAMSERNMLRQEGKTIEILDTEALSVFK